MASLSFYEKQHVQKLLRQEGQIKYIFDEFVRNAGQLLTQWRAGSSENVWIRNSAIEKDVERELVRLHSNLLSNIDKNTSEAWSLSNRKIDDLVKWYVKDLAINENVKKGMFSHNEKAMQVFRDRKIAGKSISGRVWDVTESAKDNIEYYLSSGLSTGRPAALVSQDIRQMLNNPDRRFRRVRNGKGKLVASKPMANYNPGRGAYRSSYKNALRLSATQTNMSYRMSDHERWKELDFVLGFEVNRSKSAKKPCPICDPLVGRYPKDFIYPGWHPFCICPAVPIMLEGEEFTDYLITGEIPKGKMIQDIPASAKSFVASNKYFAENNIAAKDNSKWFEGATKVENAELYEKITKTEDSIRMNKSFETAVVFNSQGDILIDKRGEATSVGFTRSESLKMKDAILTHNHPRGWKSPERSLGRIGNSFSTDDLYTAINCDLAEIRAVTPNYTFSMKRPTNGWGMTLEEAKKYITEQDIILRSEFEKRIFIDNTLTVNQANATHYHILCKRVSEKYGWEYSKEKTR